MVFVIHILIRKHRRCEIDANFYTVRERKEGGALKVKAARSDRSHVAPSMPGIVQCPDYEVRARLLRGIHISVNGVCNYGMVGASQAAATRAYGGSKKSRYLVRIEKLRIAFGGREKWRLPVLIVKLPKQECHVFPLSGQGIGLESALLFLVPHRISCMCRLVRYLFCAGSI